MLRNREKKMDREELISLLGASEAFSSASRQALESLVDSGEVRTIEPGNELIRQGATGESIWLLLEGDLEVLVGAETANRIQGRGEVLGEISAVSHSAATATVVARTEGSALCIPHQALNKAMENDPDLAASMLRSMAKYLGRL